MVSSPEQYRWSSYHAKIAEGKFQWLDRDPGYLSLGNTDFERQVRYRAWVASGTPEAEGQLIRQAIQRGQLTGSEYFISQTEDRIGRRVQAQGRVRPRKK